MSENRRQPVGDMTTLTRSEVARRLNRDVSWVRRREGRELHPNVVDGVHRFDRQEVDALDAQLRGDAGGGGEHGDAMLVRWFVAHAKKPAGYSVDGIAERTGLRPEAVRSAHARWKGERRREGITVPALLTRAELQTAAEREFVAIEREYDRRAAAWAHEDAERRRREEAVDRRERAEREQRLAAEEAARTARYEEHLARREVEHRRRLAEIRARAAPLEALVAFVSNNPDKALELWKKVSS